MTGPGPARQAQNGEGTKILLSQNEEPGTKHQEHNNMQIQRFEDIEAWQLGRELTRLVYQITQPGNFVRDFGLKDQIQRASGSIMHNIALCPVGV